ncbi:hypothetical protein QBC46DRAFT_413954 [Diplogelasinospora grovesii]|uniref:Uncharacterized protein n=1 Tax=Diplogelasinospora grovesii TaxID=303347 RepID=A0AAN6MWW7_9PEZI|nr:hypothetical protein QBC46DRAFT_413954 [Diplogelasinospora grovesii]
MTIVWQAGWDFWTDLLFLATKYFPRVAFGRIPLAGKKTELFMRDLETVGIGTGTIAATEAVLNGTGTIEEWRRAFWAELGAHAATRAIDRGFGQFREQRHCYGNHVVVIDHNHLHRLGGTRGVLVRLGLVEYVLGYAWKSCYIFRSTDSVS